MYEANDFIKELKSIKEEIDSKFTKKPRYCVVEEKNQVLKGFLKSLDFYLCKDSAKTALKEMESFLDHAIRIAENPQSFLDFEKHKPSSKQYAELWKDLKTKITIIQDTTESLSIFIKQINNEITVINMDEQFTLSPVFSQKLEKNLIIFNKRAAAHLDFYEPLITNKKKHKYYKRPQRSKEIRQLLWDNHEKIIFYNQTPSLPKKTYRLLRERREEGPNYSQTPEILFKLPENNHDLKENPNN